jgi:hypothetical protein
MPRRIRHAKRRTNDDAEAKAWETMFECGYDFFDELEPFGFASEEDAKASAQDAWKRLGVRFMEQWRAKPHSSARATPWAFDQFGEPPCR